MVDLPTRIVLIPVDDDPLEAVRDAVGDRFEGTSVAELKQEGRETAHDEVEDEIQDREHRRTAAEKDQHGS